MAVVLKYHNVPCDMTYSPKGPRMLKYMAV